MAIKEICGCIHLHTTYSDGGCGYEALVRAARGAGLDYICVTDHMTLGGLDAGYEGRRGGVFTLIGYEHNDAENHNHYLAFGISETAGDLTNPQEYIDRVRELGGIGFLAHPAEKRDYFGNLPPYPWTEWGVTGFDGIEIWNQISDWMEQLRGWQSVRKLVFPNRYIKNAPQELLDRWDEMNRGRFVSAIGGVDAHSRKFSYGPFKYTIFPINVELRGIRTHLYVDEADWSDDAKAGGAIIAAMKDGRGFMSNHYRGDARGSMIYLLDKNGETEYPGRPSGKTALPATLHIRLPQKAQIRLLRNGETAQTAAGCSAALTITENGVYRVEACRGKSAWIYSNPFPVGQYPL